MNLFDEIPRLGQIPARDDEPLFNYLNTSGRPSVEGIRTTLELWFQKIPESATKNDLRARFRSPTDSQHQSAFFEIYLHQLLSCMGFSVTVHPNLTGKVRTHPDFEVLQADKRCFYLEATLALASRSETAENVRMDQVYDTLNAMKSPNFFLAIRLQGAPATPPPGASLRLALKRWLLGLDPHELGKRFDKMGFDGLPTYEWSHDGWDLSFFPIAKPPSLQGQKGVRPIGMKMPEMKTLNSQKAMKTAVGSKATKYGDLDLPFVVAVNAIDKFRLARDRDIIDALFGAENVTGTQRMDGTIEYSPGRSKNGAWYGPQGQQNTRVSAALIFLNMNEWNMADQSQTMIHNPWAARPLVPDLWPLSQLIPNRARGCLESQIGLTSNELLGFPTPWPPEDDAWKS